MIFDTHTHYDDEAFQPDRADLMKKLRENGIGKVVNASSDWESLENTKALADQYDFVFAAYGLHPENLDSVPEGMTEEQASEAIRNYLSTPKAVAVGEIGLDYYWEKDPVKQEKQKHWFRMQLQMAREEKLPVIIHSRDAAEDTLQIAKEEKLGEIGGVIHCFSYSREIAAEYLKMGMYLGIGGVVTYKNSRKLGTAGAGNGLSVSDSCSKPGAEKFFSESALCHTGNRPDQGDFSGRGGRHDMEKRPPAVSDGRIRFMTF